VLACGWSWVLACGWWWVLACGWWWVLACGWSWKRPPIRPASLPEAAKDVRDWFEGEADESKKVPDRLEEQTEQPDERHQVCSGLDLPPQAEFVPEPQNKPSRAEDQEEYNQL